jgi:Subtilase family
MAIISGQALAPDPRAAGAGQRVVVKLRAAIPPPAPGESSAQPLADIWGRLEQQYPGVAVRPYFSDGVSTGVTGLPGAPPSVSDAMDTQRYWAIDVPPGVAPHDVALSVRDAQGVEIAYPEGGPTPPPVSPSDDPRSGNQGYLDAAPGGVDARWVWDFGVADGSGVGFVDLEQGWTLDHEDLVEARITLLSGQNRAYHGHGTAVLGEVAAVDNARGGVGISPAVTTRVVSQWRTATSYSTAEAILDAARQMQAGDVLLLEAQTTYPTVSGFVPVEIEELVFDAIRVAVSRGIVVVEAAGNGSVDLDQLQDVNGRHILNRQSEDFRDSGAIMVGAGSSGVPHTRLRFSNFGSRVDCFGWGERIDTCGDGWTGQDPAIYTTGFGGTSGASPIVTGAALLLQAFRISAGLRPYTPARLRDMLSATADNTPSANAGTDLIGVMPNLRAIIESERAVSPSPNVEPLSVLERE